MPVSPATADEEEAIEALNDGFVTAGDMAPLTVPKTRATQGPGRVFIDSSAPSGR